MAARHFELVVSSLECLPRVPILEMYSHPAYPYSEYINTRYRAKSKRVSIAKLSRISKENVLKYQLHMNKDGKFLR